MAMEKVIEVGVVVKDLDNAIKLFTEVLGAKLVQEMEFEPYGMKFAMCRIGDVDFELMCPTMPDGVIGKFLGSRGEGLHHIALKSDNIDKDWEELEKKGIRLIDKKPNEYEGHKFGFIHPKAFNGVMFEIIQE